MALVCLYLDGCHRSFHNHHEVKSQAQIVKLFDLVQECAYEAWVFVRSLRGSDVVREYGEDVK